MFKTNVEDLLIEQLKSECHELYTGVYKELISKELTKAAKQALTTDKVFGYLAKNDNYLANFSEEELIELAKRFYDGGNLKFYCDNNVLFVIIPVLERLLNSKDRGIVNFASRKFFKLYCAGDMTQLFINGKYDGVGRFSYSTITGIKSLMEVKKHELSLVSVVDFLKYVNFEKSKKPKGNRYEYLKELSSIYDELYSYFSFSVNDSTSSKYDSLINDSCSWTYKYTDSELAYSNGNRDLIKFYFGEEFNIRNYQDFKAMEKKISNSDKRKEMLLASFCYSEYGKNVFFNEFDDVRLTIDDLVLFIKKYEAAGNMFTERQAHMLLKSFTKKYFDQYDVLDSYDTERNMIKQAYSDYYLENFAFTNFEFIDYFNKTYNNCLKTFNYNGDLEKLDYRMLMSVIGDNSVGFEKLEGTKLYDAYLADDHEMVDLEEVLLEEEASKAYREAKFNEFVELLPNYVASGYTQEYFLRKTVGYEGYDIGKEVFSWVGQDLIDSFSVRNNEVLINTREKLKEDLKEDFYNHPMSQRREIFDLYKSYIESDGVSEVFSENELTKYILKIVKERYESLSDEVIHCVSDTINNDDNLYLAVCKLGFDTVDLKRYIRSGEIDESVLRRYFSDKQAYYDSIAIDKDLSLTSEVEEKPKVSEQKYVVDNAKEIISSMRNGVVMPNGDVRDYTYFDLLRAVGQDLKPHQAYNLFFEESENLEDKAAAYRFFQQYKFDVGFKFADFHRQYPFARHILSSNYTAIVNGEEHKVTQEEREDVLMFLQTYNFPSCLYYEAINSYLNGEFDPKQPLENHLKVITVEDSSKKVFVKEDKKN